MCQSFIMADLSLSGFVNVGKLENVLAQLMAKMESQQHRIDSLEAQLSSSISLSAFNTYSARMEETITALQSRYDWLEKQTLALQEENVKLTQGYSALKILQHKLDDKIDASVYHEKLEEFHTQLVESLTSLKNDKASKTTVSAIESSQHKLVQEIMAMQKLVACKIDRVEVPLIDAAMEKMNLLLDFQDSASTRIEKLEHDVTSLNKAVEKKESKEAIIQRMQVIHEHLQKKVDTEYLKTHVLTPLSETQDHVAKLSASEETLQKLVEEHHSVASSSSSYYHTLESHSEKLDSISLSILTLKEQLDKKADVKQLDGIILENSTEIENILQLYERKFMQEQKLSAAHLAEIKVTLKNLIQSQTQQEQKLIVALKFIDWFTDVKLKHM